MAKDTEEGDQKDSCHRAHTVGKKKKANKTYGRSPVFLHQGLLICFPVRRSATEKEQMEKQLHSGPYTSVLPLFQE